MMTTGFNLVFLGGVIALLSQNALADAQGLKIGYVNYDLAAAQEDEARKYVVELESEEKKIHEAKNKARKDIEAEVSKFQSSMSKLDEAAKLAAQTALGNKINALEQQFNQQVAELEQKKHAKQAELQRKNQLLVDSIARERSYDLVINAAAIVYVSESLKKNDVTQELVTRYNKAYRPEPPKKEPAKKGASEDKKKK